MVDNQQLDVFSIVEKQYMPPVLESVRERANEIAHDNGHEVANFAEVFRAFEQRFTGGVAVAAPQPQAPSIWRENLFLIIAVTMTVIFGVMGLLPYLLGNVDPVKVGYKPEFFLDIAKLFAGVVVGGAAGVANAAVAARRAKG